MSFSLDLQIGVIRSNPRRFRPMEEERSKELGPDNSVVAAAAAAVANQLTDDLIVEILSRLPFRSVNRFKCVSKHWREVIAHPAHRKKLPQTLAGFLYMTCQTSPGGYGHHLAGVSVEAEAEAEEGYITGVNIYSSRTGAWSQRDTGLVEKIRLYNASVLVGGMLHVIGNIDGDNSVLLAVDMEGKVWKTISVPHGWFSFRIGWSQGCLYYASQSPTPLTVGDDEDEDALLIAAEIAVWCLKDYDSQQWVLKHSFRIDKLLNLAEVEYELVGIHPDHDTIFFVAKGLYDGDARGDASLVSWDMRRQEICNVLDLEKGSVGKYLPYVPLFSSESLADADGHQLV